MRPPRRDEHGEDWQPNDGNGYYRNFEGENREVAAGTKYGAQTAVYAHGAQHDDESIEDGSGRFFDAPGISILTIDAQDGRQTDIGISLSSAAARQLADVLVTAADEADRCSTR